MSDSLIAVHDERIMADGRPAFAWWNEIQLLRAEKAQATAQRNEVRTQAAILRVVEMHRWQDMSGDIHLVLTRRAMLECEPPTVEALAEKVRLADER